MTKAVLIGLVGLAVGIGAAALAWNRYAPAAPSEAVAAAKADAPSAGSIFPKVLNR